MKINLKRTGGFGNIPMNVAVDTESLSADNKDKLKSMLDKAIPMFGKSQVKPDTYSYALEVQDDTVQNYAATDLDSPEVLDLIEYLSSL